MSKKQLHILLVDDDDESRKTIHEYLVSMGYEKVTLARDGAEAIRILDKDSTIGFIVSDWDMPLLNGLEFLQRVRSNPARSHIPFLIATSPISKEAEKVVLAAENLVDSYIIKPFRVNALKEKIDSILEMAVHGPRKQAVVVDDNADARSMISEYLRKFGFKDVRDFEDAKSALAYLLQHPGVVGLIISDWEMPDMNGLDFLKTCKSSQTLAEIPFLMVTSQTSMERMKVVQAARAQVDQYLLKPFGSKDLKERIDQLMDRVRNRKEVQGLLAIANDHFEHGRYQRAQAILEEALKLDPEHELALRGMGDALIKVKGVEAALPYYKKAVESNSLNATSYIRLGMAYEQVGLLDKGIQLLITANQLINFSAELHFHLGRLYNKKGLMAEARTEFEKTLELQLDHQEARLMLQVMGIGRAE